MSYLVLARKWRPRRFEDVIGQEHVTRALCNAIRLDRVAHAFLFAGARGVGKTTTARILSKALQCESGPTQEPCGECNACKEVTSGNCVDVFEIDGASNRGINEIRELREAIAYAPQRDRFKIYIIDEVHMLTSEAFNALLKTLEEPPKHVKFIFATTEPQKIPVTILSRCQRYDFKRVPLSVVKNHLDSLLEREGVEIAEDGVRMIARESEGSVRDALSLLDRVISFSGDRADAQMVAESLGVADRKWLHRLLKSLLAGVPAPALEVVSDVSHYGYDLSAFCSELLETFRDLIVVKVCGTEKKQVDLSDAELKALARLGDQHSLAALQRMFHILLKASDEVAASRHPQLVLEMAVVRCCTAHGLLGVPEILQRLEALEQRLDGNPALSQVIQNVAQVSSPVQAQYIEEAIAPTEPMVPAEPAPSPEPETEVVPDVVSDVAPVEETLSEPEPEQPPVEQPSVSIESEKPHPETQADNVVETSVSQPKANPAPPKTTRQRRDTQPASTAAPAHSHTMSASEWPHFVSHTKETDPLLASILENAEILEATPTLLRVGVVNFFYRSQMSEGPNHQRIKQLLAQTYGDIKFVVEKVEEVSGTLAQEATTQQEKHTAEQKAALKDHPVTQAVIEDMAGQLIDIKLEDSINE